MTLSQTSAHRLRTTASQLSACFPVPAAWRRCHLPMSSYYREHVSFPNVTSGPAPPYPPPLTAVNGAHTFAHGGSTSGPQEEGSNARHCSVKGCAAVLAPAYPHKMCEECRSRHRTYANTKRAKRKMEKALLNSGQPVAWMPDDGTSQQDEQAHPGEPVAGPSRSFEVSACPSRKYRAYYRSSGRVGERFRPRRDACATDATRLSFVDTSIPARIPAVSPYNHAHKSSGPLCDH